MSNPKRIFVSFSHVDTDFRDALSAQLSLLRREGAINDWHDGAIEAGEDFQVRIRAELSQADIILLLVSADFLASDYCWDVEMKVALDRHREGAARVIPIIIRPCDWQSAPFGSLVALPKDGKPVSTWNSADTAWVNVIHGLRRVLSS